MRNFTEAQEVELGDKLAAFEKSIESDIELTIESEKEAIKDGEYKYIIEGNEECNDVELSEDLAEALKKSSLTKKDLIKKAIEDGHFKMRYDEQSSPFQYGGALEDEFKCLEWGGDRDCQIDRERIEEFLPSFDLSDYFETFKEFEDFVKRTYVRIENLKLFYEFATSDKSHGFVIYNTDYDIIRCILSDDEILIKYLEANPKKLVPFKKKKLRITMDEFNDLRDANDGFCVKCGKINEGFHEPDAENYECSHCEERESFGMDTLFMNGTVQLVEDEDESDLDDAY